MPTYSRTSLAKGAVTLLKKHSLPNVAGAVALAMKKQRLGRDVPGMVALLAEELLMARGHLLARVVSAKPVSIKTRKIIETYLRKTCFAKTIGVDYEVDPLLVGGIKVVTPLGVLDLSIADTLKQLVNG